MTKLKWIFIFGVTGVAHFLFSPGAWGLIGIYLLAVTAWDWRRFLWKAALTISAVVIFGYSGAREAAYGFLYTYDNHLLVWLVWLTLIICVVFSIQRSGPKLSAGAVPELDHPKEKPGMTSRASPSPSSVLAAQAVVAALASRKQIHPAQLGSLEG